MCWSCPTLRAKSAALLYRRPFRIISFIFWRSDSMSGSAKDVTSVFTLFVLLLVPVMALEIALFMSGVVTSPGWHWAASLQFATRVSEWRLTNELPLVRIHYQKSHELSRQNPNRTGPSGLSEAYRTGHLPVGMEGWRQCNPLLRIGLTARHRTCLRS